MDPKKFSLFPKFKYLHISQRIDKFLLSQKYSADYLKWGIEYMYGNSANKSHRPSDTTADHTSHLSTDSTDTRTEGAESSEDSSDINEGMIKLSAEGTFYRSAQSSHSLKLGLHSKYYSAKFFCSNDPLISASFSPALIRKYRTSVDAQFKAAEISAKVNVERKLKMLHAKMYGWVGVEITPTQGIKSHSQGVKMKFRPTENNQVVLSL